MRNVFSLKLSSNTLISYLGYMKLPSNMIWGDVTEGLGWSCYKSHRPSVFSALNSVSLGSKNPQVQNIWWAEWAVLVLLVCSTLNVSLPGFKSPIW